MSRAPVAVMAETMVASICAGVGGSSSAKASSSGVSFYAAMPAAEKTSVLVSRAGSVHLSGVLNESSVTSSGTCRCSRYEQRPITLQAGEEKVSAAAWKSLPSWAIYGAKDLAIPPAALAFMAERAKARKVVVVPGASHVVMLSHPHEVAKLRRSLGPPPWGRPRWCGPLSIWRGQADRRDA